MTKGEKFILEFRDHNKFLKRVGSTQMTLGEYTLYRQGKLRHAHIRKPLSTPVYVSEHRKLYPSTDTGGITITKNTQLENERLQASSQYVVGQAYHKGGMVVLSKAEAMDPATAKRQ